MDYEIVRELAQANLMPDYITIDIAHGHSLSVKEMIAHIRSFIPDAFIIAGNVATPVAVRDLESWGADATKIGVGPGKACTTRLKTGFGTAGWQLSAVMHCATAASKPVIADGGIRNHGQIAKALRFGGTMVMVGSMFAGHEQSPGKTVIVNGVRYKEFYGSASAQQKGESRHVEGRVILEPIKGCIRETLLELEQDLQSAISYAGGHNLEALRNCNYVLLNGNDNAATAIFEANENILPSQLTATTADNDST